MKAALAYDIQFGRIFDLSPVWAREGFGSAHRFKPNVNR
jgi:hypothetical protein